MRIRKHMIFRGEVQGVGFRYRAYRCARELGLSGWVRNSPDGSVEMEVQGREEEIVLLVKKMQGGMWIRITEIEEEELPVRPEKEFRIDN